MNERVRMIATIQRNSKKNSRKCQFFFLGLVLFNCSQTGRFFHAIERPTKQAYKQQSLCTIKGQLSTIKVSSTSEPNSTYLAFPCLGSSSCQFSDFCLSLCLCSFSFIIGSFWSRLSQARFEPKKACLESSLRAEASLPCHSGQSSSCHQC